MNVLGSFARISLPKDNNTATKSVKWFKSHNDTFDGYHGWQLLSPIAAAFSAIGGYMWSDNLSLLWPILYGVLGAIAGFVPFFLIMAKPTYWFSSEGLWKNDSNWLPEFHSWHLVNLRETRWGFRVNESSYSHDSLGKLGSSTLQQLTRRQSAFDTYRLANTLVDKECMRTEPPLRYGVFAILSILVLILLVFILPFIQPS